MPQHKLTSRLAQAFRYALQKLTTCHRYALPSLLYTPVHTMMKRHWAPTILDGHAYHGRPQKPRRLILLHRLDFERWKFAEPC
jgi:hypothetical protein